MAEEFQSPEERLLRLIRRKGKSAPEGPASPANRGERTSPLSFLQRRPKGEPRPEPARRFEEPILIEFPEFLLRAQQFLWILVGVALVFLFTGRWLTSRTPMTAAALLEKGSSPQEFSVALPTAPRSSEEYLQTIQKRDLFQPSLPSKEGGSSTPSALEARLKDFVLMGIISGKTPQAIVEDKKEQKTHFLREGEGIGGLRVEQILEGKVILTYEGEQFELVL